MLVQGNPRPVQQLTGTHFWWSWMRVQFVVSWIYDVQYYNYPTERLTSTVSRYALSKALQNAAATNERTWAALTYDRLVNRSSQIWRDRTHREQYCSCHTTRQKSEVGLNCLKWCDSLPSFACENQLCICCGNSFWDVITWKVFLAYQSHMVIKDTQDQVSLCWQLNLQLSQCI